MKKVSMFTKLKIKAHCPNSKRERNILKPKEA